MQQFLASLLSTLLCFFGQCLPQTEQKPLQEIKIGLSWIHEAQYAGLYAADQLGYYTNEGLLVTFVPYDNQDLAEELQKGTFDMVFLQTDSLLLAREKGLPVKGIFANYKIIPTVYFSKKNKNITKPKDLIGKTVGVAYSERYPLVSLLENAGIDSKKVKIVDREYSYEPLKNNVYDVEAGWVTDGDAVQKAIGSYNALNPYDYGVNWYADILTVTDTRIQHDQDTLKKFIKATIKGWQHAVEQPDKAALYTLKYDSSLSSEHLKFVLNVSIPHIHTGDGNFGMMTKDTFENAETMLKKQKILKTTVDASSVFTTEFITQAQQELRSMK